jgi:hypothetical protein
MEYQKVGIGNWATWLYKWAVLGCKWAGALARWVVSACSWPTYPEESKQSNL